MNVIILGLYFFLSISLVALDFYKKFMPFSILSGILFILIGLFIGSGNPITQSFCEYDGISSMVCTEHTLPSLPVGSGINVDYFGIMIILTGLGIILNSIIRYIDERGEYA